MMKSGCWPAGSSGSAAALFWLNRTLSRVVSNRTKCFRNKHILDRSASFKAPVVGSDQFGTWSLYSLSDLWNGLIAMALQNHAERIAEGPRF